MNLAKAIISPVGCGPSLDFPDRPTRLPRRGHFFVLSRFPMKGIQGLIVAGLLALVGGVCNWLYLANQADRYERVAFIAVKSDEIRIGEKFKAEDFLKVEIPRNNLGNLEKIAVRFDEHVTVVGQVATRTYTRDQLILWHDLKTPAKSDLNELITEDELIFWLPVDPRTFNPQQVNPGDLVSFRVPRHVMPTPVTEGVGSPEPVPMAVEVAGGDEIIGPFKILALGNRKGRPEVAKAAGQSSGSETTLTLIAQFPDKKLERKAQRIFQVLEQTGFKGVQPLLHPAGKGKKALP